MKLIMDNGGSSIKCGYAGDEDPKMYLYSFIKNSDLLNATAYVTKTLFHLVADEIYTKVKQKSQLRFHLPFERYNLHILFIVEVILLILMSVKLFGIDCFHKIYSILYILSLYTYFNRIAKIQIYL